MVRTLALLNAAWLIAASLATPSLAQGGAAPGLGGAPVPGLCLVSRQAIFANAKIGVAATARLREITAQAQAEINAERAPLDTEIKAFQAEAPRLPAAQREIREKALNARVQAIQAKTQLRSREIDATRTKALDRISTEAQPVIAQVYTAHKCGLLMDRNAVLGGNLSNDLTPDVIRGLDARITTISFARETLPANGAVR